MSTNGKVKATSPTGSCGCGSMTAPSMSSCSCGGAGCASCNAQGTFVRPRFFAGQLLTEDDLQQLNDYVVKKNRLHNRFLFGEGVVCGLQVTCHPCGEGHVTVQPGYALDCCGNDLTLSCPQSLDINAMVRELRRKLLGADCGDPCADKSVTKDDNLRDTVTDGKTEEKPTEPTRHYCLYIRYCEESTDPVAPYATGEPCGAQVCEPTRVREGIQFELRCREEGHRAASFLSRICQCLGDPDGIEKSAKDGLYFHTEGRQLRSAVREITAHSIPSFEGNQVTELDGAFISLRTAWETLRNVPKNQKEEFEEAFRLVLDAALETASLLARFYSGRIQEAEIGFAKLVREAKEELRPILSQDIEEILNSPLEKEVALALMGLIRKLLRDKPPSDDPEIRFLAEKVVYTSRVRAMFARALHELREWLLDRLDKSPYLTDCGLRQIARQIVLPTLSLRDEVGSAPAWSQDRLVSDALVTSKAAESLLSVFIRYLRDCLCAALNPVCQPCDDPALLLACLEVKGCEVARICNLERTFVLSPAAVRYWVPFNLLGKVVEQVCCPIEECPDTGRTLVKGQARRLFAKSGDRGSLPGFVQVLAALLSEICGKERDQLQRVLVPLLLLVEEANVAGNLLSQPGAFSTLSAVRQSVVESEEPATIAKKERRQAVRTSRKGKSGHEQPN